MDSGVEPEAADRIVDVRRVAAEKDPALAELLRDALMDVVEVQVNPIGASSVNAGKPGSHGRVRQRFLVALVGSRVVDRAPAALEVVARDLEEVGPLVLARHVVAEAAAERLLEIELGGDDEEPLRPGIALELDVEAFAHRAAPAV